MSLLPSGIMAGAETPILPAINTLQFTKCYLSNMNFEDRKKGNISPLYNEFSGLVDALFIIGTEDSLMDDTVLLHFKWIKAGNKATLKFVAGAPHGFMTFDGNKLECAREGWRAMIEYINDRL
jgi:acetyl esterase